MFQFSLDRRTQISNSAHDYHSYRGVNISWLRRMNAAASDTTNYQNEVPNSKAKLIAPVDLRQKLFMTPLPSYSGPYNIRYMKIEVPARHPRGFSHIR